MMDRILARFDGYMLREVSVDTDIRRLVDWISADPYHQHIKPEFFLGKLEDPKGYVAKSDPRPTCYAMEDEEGVIFYIRIDRAARVNIQFQPLDPKFILARGRVAKALLKGMAALELGFRQANVSEWVFESQAPDLRLMARTRLGFLESPHDLVRPIPILTAREPEEEPIEARQTPLREVN